MKHIKVNTTWEEDAEARRRFFAKLSYSERLRYYFKLRDMVNFHKRSSSQIRVLKVYRNYNAV